MRRASASIAAAERDVVFDCIGRPRVAPSTRIERLIPYDVATAHFVDARAPGCSKKLWCRPPRRCRPAEFPATLRTAVGRPCGKDCSWPPCWDRPPRLCVVRRRRRAEDRRSGATVHGQDAGRQRLRPRKPQGAVDGPLFLPESRHARLHQARLRVPRQHQAAPRRGRRGVRHQHGHRRNRRRPSTRRTSCVHAPRRSSTEGDMPPRGTGDWAA